MIRIVSKTLILLESGQRRTGKEVDGGEDEDDGGRKENDEPEGIDSVFFNIASTASDEIVRRQTPRLAEWKRIATDGEDNVHHEHESYHHAVHTTSTATMHSCFCSLAHASSIARRPS